MEGYRDDSHHWPAGLSLSSDTCVHEGEALTAAESASFSQGLRFGLEVVQVVAVCFLPRISLVRDYYWSQGEAELEPVYQSWLESNRELESLQKETVAAGSETTGFRQPTEMY